MKIVVTDNSFSLVSNGKRTLLDSWGYSTKGNATRAARKAKYALMYDPKKTLTLSEDGHLVELLASNGHILASRYFDQAGNARRAHANVMEQIMIERERAEPLPVITD